MRTYNNFKRTTSFVTVTLPEQFCFNLIKFESEYIFTKLMYFLKNGSCCHYFLQTQKTSENIYSMLTSLHSNHGSSSIFFQI